MFVKLIALADSMKWELGDARNPYSGPAISTSDTAPPALPISDSVLPRGTHDQIRGICF
jgi:hypothetical protein